jgi:hypothetical protein
MNYIEYYNKQLSKDVLLLERLLPRLMLYFPNHEHAAHLPPFRRPQLDP